MRPAASSSRHRKAELGGPGSARECRAPPRRVRASPGNPEPQPQLTGPNWYCRHRQYRRSRRTFQHPGNSSPRPLRIWIRARQPCASPGSAISERELPPRLRSHCPWYGFRVLARRRPAICRQPSLWNGSWRSALTLAAPSSNPAISRTGAAQTGWPSS
jgi:hypothetical protein